MKHLLGYIVALALCVHSVGLCQRPGVTRAQIEAIRSQVALIYGNAYRISGIVNVDSSIRNKHVSEGKIEDPYKTLSGCYLFVAIGKRIQMVNLRGFIGVFKNNKILWKLDTLINCDEVRDAGILETTDLNRDGKVEIITSWLEGDENSIEYLWIVSWDGSTGQLINSYDRFGRSELVSEARLFEFLDTDGDGIQEIQGDLHDSPWSQRSLVLFKWNGRKYEETIRSENLLPPRDKLNCSLSCSVVMSSAGYQYRYVVKNDSKSFQPIDDLLLEPAYGIQPGKVGTRPGWKVASGQQFIRWTHFKLLAGPMSSDILPGEIDSSLSFESQSPPTVTSCYVEGRNGDDFSGELIRTNSIAISTLAPTIFRSPNLAISEFLDTLISYKHQALALNWIDNEGVANSLDQKLENAKMKLEDRDSVAARNILQAFVDEVEAQKDKHLTSEAYALLKFNAEYLIDRLPLTGKPEKPKEKK